MRVKVRQDQRSSPDALANLYLRSKTGQMISLATLVTLEERPALQSITRRDRARAITITANVAPGHSQQEVLAEVRTMQASMPPGYKLVLAGASASFNAPRISSARNADEKSGALTIVCGGAA